MWKGQKVSLVFPTYNEKDSIYKSIEDFYSSGLVDEVIVVNNNAAEGTDEEVKKTNARLLYDTRQGYGYAIRKGLDEVSGDIIIISEPDGTFSGNDVIKLLAYSDDCEVVFGTRTSREFIWAGANMGWFLKVGNYCVAKMVEFLFYTTFLSDVGCTMKLLKKSALDKFRGQFTVGGSHFGLELMLLVIVNNIKFVEIPINYKKRVGRSSVTGNKLKAFLLGMQMIGTVLKYWVLFIFRIIPRH